MSAKPNCRCGCPERAHRNPVLGDLGACRNCASWNGYAEACRILVGLMEAQELRQDALRLDWLNANYGIEKQFWYGQRDLREAVDLAMRGGAA